jgi:membrane-associated PAP2 superfamily phosphatase
VSRKTQLLLLALLCLWAAGMAWVPSVDFRWTEQLTALRHTPFAGFARRTLFQGQLPGATDPAALLALGILGAYLLAGSRRASRRLREARPVLGYLLASALLAGLAVVEALKLMLGRARPLDVLSRQHLPYTDWYQLGSLHVTAGLFRASFPSGHTAAVFTILALAYALGFDPAAGRRARTAGAALALLSLAAAGAMTGANAMGGSHWLSDGLGAIGLVWLLVHQLYFRVLDVPGQRRYLLAHGQGPPLPRFWEARLCAAAVLTLAGATLALLGLRALAEQRPPAFALLQLLLPGAVLLALGVPHARALAAALPRALATAPKTPPAAPEALPPAPGAPAQAVGDRAAVETASPAARGRAAAEGGTRQGSR